MEPRSSLRRELLLALAVKFFLLALLWMAFVREQAPPTEKATAAALLNQATFSDGTGRNDHGT